MILVAAGALLLLGCDLEDLEAPRVESTNTEQSTFAVAGRTTLVIETTNGDVTVQGVTGQTQVQVTTTLRSRGDTLAEANRRLGQLTVVRAQEGDRITLRYRADDQPEDVRRSSAVDFAVTVPLDTDASVAGTNGKLTAESLRGTLALETTNGSVTVAIQRESPLLIDARTSTIGSIRTDLPLVGDTEGKAWSATLNPPATATLTLRTTNGAIRIEALK
jgi:DUF4097 and DUF4098 domain-containing protein YvlB